VREKGDIDIYQYCYEKDNVRYLKILLTRSQASNQMQTPFLLLANTDKLYGDQLTCQTNLSI
jgi:hypothetical protein